MTTNKKLSRKSALKISRQTQQADWERSMEALHDEIYRKFKRVSFRSRVKILNYFARGAAVTKSKQVRQFFADYRDLLNKKHIRLTAAEVARRYDLENRAVTEADFYRICKAENIKVADERYMASQAGTNLNTPQTLACIFILKSGSKPEIILSAQTGQAQLESMFRLLGCHFLKNPYIRINDPALGTATFKFDHPRTDILKGGYAAEAALFGAEVLKNTFGEPQPALEPRKLKAVA